MVGRWRAMSVIAVTYSSFVNRDFVTTVLTGDSVLWYNMCMNFFERKVYSQLLSWKDKLAGKYALLVEGARRVGKTSVIRRFIEAEYENYIYIDFSSKEKKIRDVRKAFQSYADIGDLLLRLQLIFEVRLVEGRSCVVFDEVQLFPTAREAIKHLVEYGKYHYIESGSLVGIKENVKDILIPSEEHKLKMYPMDFEEYLLATGRGMLLEHIQDCFKKHVALAKEVHDQAMDMFRSYLVVGGMPQSVEAYIDTETEKRFDASETAKREILSLYEDDIGKYAHGYAAKVRDIFKTIPSALRRHEKTFHLADIDVNARMRRYENAFLWLDDAMVVNTAYNATSPDLGIAMSEDHSSFKCYYADTGLLITAAMGRTVDPRVLRGVLHDNLGIDEGMFFENVVAQTFASKGEDLRFYSCKNREDESATMEVDFLLSRGIKICPVEVKSGKYRAHASLDRMIAKYGRHLGRKFVICTGGYEESADVTYLPAYMAHLI